MLNLTGIARAPRQDWEVTLRRKESAKGSQLVRARVEHVNAHDREEAKAAALAINDNSRYFKVSSGREVR